ncbi:hypothetical protein TRIUR3_26673 [Triticum urartu]|uniref:Uncharacterized protein n=1 Tax=Triticum urartu TaxID=4572 RepID=M7Z6A8_TRIUA|nr:hypothetical protein TRIUR3_26673 [Triticum urartu]
MTLNQEQKFVIWFLLEMIADSNLWLLAVVGVVRAKLDMIMALDYYTAAAVGGSYGAEDVQAQESITIQENLAAEGHKLSGSGVAREHAHHVRPWHVRPCPSPTYISPPTPSAMGDGDYQSPALGLMVTMCAGRAAGTRDAATTALPPILFPEQVNDLGQAALSPRCTDVIVSPLLTKFDIALQTWGLHRHIIDLLRHLSWTGGFTIASLTHSGDIGVTSRLAPSSRLDWGLHLIASAVLCHHLIKPSSLLRHLGTGLGAGSSSRRKLGVCHHH